MGTVLGRILPLVVRVHVSGDFYSASYTDDWRRIASDHPRTTFYAYTRSWRIPYLLDALVPLAQLPNVRLWFSADDDTGPPPAVPNVRVAWLQTHGQQGVGAADLIFRDHAARGSVVRRIGLTLVCPVENGTGSKTDCTRCTLCWA